MTYKHIKFTESPTMRSFERVAREKGLINNKFTKLIKLIKSGQQPLLTQEELDRCTRKAKQYLTQLWQGDVVYKKISDLVGKPIDKKKLMGIAMSIIKDEKINPIIANDGEIGPLQYGLAKYEQGKILINKLTPIHIVEGVVIHEYNHYFNFFIGNSDIGISPEELEAAQVARIGNYTGTYNTKPRENVARVPEMRYALNLEQITTIDALNKSLSNIIQGYDFDPSGNGYINSYHDQADIEVYKKYYSHKIEEGNNIQYVIFKEKLSNERVRKFFLLEKIESSIKKEFAANSYSLASLLMQFFKNANFYYKKDTGEATTSIVFDINGLLRAFNELAEVKEKSSVKIV